MSETAEFTLLADYFQIHVADAEIDWDLSDAWTPQAVADHLAVAHGPLGIGTVVNVNVRVTVEALSMEARDDSAEFDHVVEASLQVPSGQLVVLGCTDYFPDADRFEVPAGWTRLRVSRSNLGPVTEVDVDSDESPERVRIQVWPAPEAEPKVIKRWMQFTG
ncbi:hypothetical protein [Streptomyces sp. NRRL S-1824]|uniref:hypothetical protein n=1 Tax=Streptomyces sp. NRRL S-1824 TaxID=1463889 RepID=UPI0004C741A8|nr:hypothetical protein [Streptomyces sp. NRRL S-1824]